jgi:hypothetical protein
VTSDSLSFEFDLKDVVFDESKDEKFTAEIPWEDGVIEEVTVTCAIDDATDWSYFKSNRTSKIKYDQTLSKNLKAGEKLYVMGFSLSLGGPDKGNVTPLYSESSVAISGISEGGLIMVSNRGFEQGNSGGPVFVMKDNMLKCIGIVSIGKINRSTGTMSSIGGLVPIANIN